jgi:hypothetical protein
LSRHTFLELCNAIHVTDLLDGSANVAFLCEGVSGGDVQGEMTKPDYIVMATLIFLLVWAVAEKLPRDKL